MRTVLLHKDESSGHMVPRPETAVETKAQVAQRRLEKLATDCAVLLGEPPRPATDGKEFLDGFFNTAIRVDLEIPEDIEKALRSTQPLPQLAMEWLRDTAAEVPFITSELRSAARMSKHLNERRETSEELAADFAAALAPV